MSERKRPVVAWDCDDVLVDTSRDAVDTYNLWHGTNVQLADFYTRGRTLEIWGADEEEASRRVEKIITRPEHELLPPNPRMVAVLRTLAGICIQDVVTSRSHAREVPTRLMLDTHYSGTIRNVHFANSYAPDIDPELRRTKGSICRDIAADIAVDDNPEHILSIMNESSVGLAILFGENQWSQGVDLGHRGVHCETPEELEVEIGRFADRFAA